MPYCLDCGYFFDDSHDRCPSCNRWETNGEMGGGWLEERGFEGYGIRELGDEGRPRGPDNERFFKDRGGPSRSAGWIDPWEEDGRAQSRPEYYGEPEPPYYGDGSWRPDPGRVHGKRAPLDGRQEVRTRTIDPYREEKRKPFTALAPMASIMIVLILIMAYLWASGLSGLVSDPSTQRYILYPESVEFELERTIKIITTGGTLLEYSFQVAVPKNLASNGKSFQEIFNLTTSKHPDSGHADPDSLGNDLLKWDGENLRNTLTVKITYEFETTQTSWNLDPKVTGTVSDYDEDTYKNLLSNEWVVTNTNGYPVDDDGDGEIPDYRIEPTDPEIMELAQEITASKVTVHEKLEALYDYLVNGDFEYRIGRSGDLPKSCIVTLDDQDGDCDDYSILFVSLCRAVGIPAWLELGILYDSGRAVWGGHAWATVALPLTNGEVVNVNVDIVNEQFMFRDPYRITDWIDDGDGDSLDEYYNTFRYSISPFSGPPQYEDTVSTISMIKKGEVRLPVED